MSEEEVEVPTRKYRNPSTSVVLGHAPGEEFEAAVPEPMRSQLIGGGALEDLEDNTMVPDPGAVRITEPEVVPTPEESAEQADSAPADSGSDEGESGESGEADAGEGGSPAGSESGEEEGGSGPGDAVINRRRRS